MFERCKLCLVFFIFLTYSGYKCKTRINHLVKRCTAGCIEASSVLQDCTLESPSKQKCPAAYLEKNQHQKYQTAA